MSITVQALARNRRHGIILLKRLATVGVNISRVHFHPAGMHRLLRNVSLLRRALAIRITRNSVVSLSIVGLITGTALALYAVFTTKPFAISQALLIIAASGVLGWTVGMLAGMIIGGGARFLLSINGNRHIAEQEDEPILMDLAADSVETAEAAETILTESGASEVHIAAFTES